MYRKSMARVALLGALLPALVLGASACSDDDDLDPCEGIADSCSVADDTTCLGDTVQTCEPNADGCLVWTDTETCGVHQLCDTGACACDDECGAGDSRCDGDVVQLCEEDADLCLYWTDDEDCGANGEVCDDTADAVCVSTQTCGNDTVEGDEVCDGADLDNQDCTDHGYYGGTLACNANCDGFVTTSCSGECGDDTVNGGEVCDGADLDNETCIDQGYFGGTLACNSTCDGYDTSSCTDSCGDDVVNGQDVCDGTDLDGENCLTQGFYGGTLACAATCDAFDTSGCIGSCGDNTINGSEVCDGTDTDGETCVSLGYDSGTLGCAGTCDALDTSNCVATPGTMCMEPIDLTGQTMPVAITGTFDDDPAVGFSCAGVPTNVLWLSYTASFTGTHRFVGLNNTSTNAWSRLAVLDGTSCSPYDTEVVCGGASSTGLTTTLDLVSGNTYLLAFFTDDDPYTMVDPDILLEPEVCGDGVVTGLETCDGTDTGTNTCVSEGFASGTLGCNATCDGFDTSSCVLMPGQGCGTAVDLSSETFPYPLTGTFSEDSTYVLSCDTTLTNSVWYEYTPSVTGIYTISATNVTTDWAYSRLAVLQGTACEPYGTELLCDTSADLTIESTVAMEAGTTYKIVFYTDDDAYRMEDPSISISAPLGIGWCNVQWPTSITTEEGQPEVIYGRVYVPGLTDRSTGIDANPLLVGQVGVGADGADPVADPTQFVWTGAVANVGASNDDEYMAAIIVPPAGTSYDYAYRFSVDGGLNWTYCDLTDNSYDVSDSGSMTPATTTVSAQPSAAGDVVITEVMQNPAVLSDANGEWFELYNPTSTDWNLNGCTVYDLDTDSITITGNFIVPAMGYSTAATSADPGFTPGYVYSGFTLANGADELYLDCGGLVIDSIEYDGGSVWPDPAGATMSLDPASTDITSNDDGTNWCEGTDVFNGDFGTPNQANPSCP